MATRDSLDLKAQEGQPPSQGLPRTTIILWLVVIGLATFFLPLYLIFNTIRDDANRLKNNLQPIRATLAAVGTPPPTVQALLDELAQVQETSNQIEQAYLSLLAGRVNWPAVMAAIGSYNPAQLTLTSLAQADNRVTLSGRAINDAAVVAYARTLEESALFSRVVIQSVKSIATPFVTPTIAGTGEPEVTLTPGGDVTPTATLPPTPNPRDEYETDDFQYKDIILGQSQRHNFNPVYDVDKVKFLAKAGRFYRVSSFDLTPGVDTFMTVSVGGTIYTNDDRRPGELASEVTFQVAPGRDVEALVKVTNRGQYGPDMWYQIAVEEVIPTPTPTPSPTPPPTPTGTSAPTATPTPTSAPANTPTATSDLRDAYEPDDVARPIAVGETQTHNFYPGGDVDKVNFLTKSERHYQVLTSDLALGVDTYLEVALGEQRWENDDYDLPGTGNFASAVCFQAPTTGSATVTISTRGQQYGPDKRYAIGVSEAPVLDVNPLTLSFGPVTQGGADPPSQPINVGRIGDSSLTWKAETDVAWLSVNPSSGSAPASVQVSVNAGGLAPAIYQGRITLSGTSLCAANSPQTVIVTLQVVAPAARRPGLALRLPAPLNAGAVEFVIVLELKAASP